MVTLISPQEIDAADEDAFLEGWKKLAAWLQTKEGFRAARLHRSVSASARFRYVGISIWDSQAAISEAMADRQFLELTDAIPVPISPNVYEIAEEVTGKA